MVGWTFKDCALPIRAATRAAYDEVWQTLGDSGPYWSGRDRVAIVREARQSLDCELCRLRLEALSPAVVQGEHDRVTHLPNAAIEVIHRIRTDPARMTKSVLNAARAAGMSDSEYIELVGVVATSVVMDTLHRALGLDVPELPVGSAEAPVGQESPEVVDGGAWVKIAPGDGQRNEVGIPRQANIIRSMGLVPAVIVMFFTVMRQAYLLAEQQISISRSQTEFIAARVSALNQCFY